MQLITKGIIDGVSLKDATPWADGVDKHGRQVVREYRKGRRPRTVARIVGHDADGEPILRMLRKGSKEPSRRCTSGGNSRSGRADHRTDANVVGDVQSVSPDSGASNEGGGEGSEAPPGADDDPVPQPKRAPAACHPPYPQVLSAYVKDGKKYDTKTAAEIASYAYGTFGDEHGRGEDPGHVTETLYRTQKSAWFVVGWGGARSRYAKQLGPKIWCGGAGCVPLQDDEAKELLEQWGETEALLKYFGDKLGVA